jgi:predicted nucleotidyltransferase component of viral defense system
MKEEIRQLIAKAPQPLLAKSLVREYCQARILQFLQERGVFRTWIFHGGTALRFLYMLPRYSEDLDFALDRPAALPDFAKIVTAVSRSFEAEAYNIETKVNDKATVKSAFIRFPGLLYELNLSLQRSQSVSIKIEIDCNPPSGGLTETSVIRRYVMLNVLHYDKATFLSGKLHALLARPYLKGRDLYDLFWYLSDPSWPDPNIKFLGEALRQTKWNGPEISKSNWAFLAAERLKNIDWTKAVEDVRPFIEKTIELSLLTRENIEKLLKGRYSQSGNPKV